MPFNRKIEGIIMRKISGSTPKFSIILFFLILTVRWTFFKVILKFIFVYSFCEFEREQVLELDPLPYIHSRESIFVPPQSTVKYFLERKGSFFSSNTLDPFVYLLIYFSVYFSLIVDINS